jgi:tripartite ATP-independent transporter DctP family solute receptor
MNKKSAVRLMAFFWAVCLSVSGVLAANAGLDGEKQVTLKLATIYAPSHPVSIGLEKLVATCYEKSGGKLDIQHFPAAQIGNEPSIHEGLRNGTVHMAVMGISEVGKRYEPVLVFDAPFLFRDADHMLRAFNGEAGRKLWKDFAAATDITMLIPIYYGTRQLTTNKAVPNTAALAGMKIRVPDQPNSVAAWKALGAVPTPMNLSEVYLSLQTGVVDGQENPLATIISSKFYEVCKFINMTNHSVQSVPLFINTKVYESLSPALKAILDEAIAADVAEISEEIKKYEVTELKRLREEEGITVVKTDYADFLAAARTVIEASEPQWGKGLYNKLQAVK